MSCRRPVITKFRLFLLAATFCSFGVIGLSVHAQKASADACSINGRSCNIGFFSGRATSSPYHNLYGPPPGPGLQVNNVKDMINTLGGRISCVGTDTPTSHLGKPWTDQNATSAAFTIITMLGMAPGTGKDAACQHWSQWRSLVTAYANAGLIQFNEVHNSGGLNTRFTFSQNSDVVFYTDDVTSNSIVIRNRAGAVLYAIKKDCGNPVGRLQKLTSLNRPPTGSWGKSCVAINGDVVDPDTPGTAVHVRVTYSSGGGPVDVFSDPSVRRFKATNPIGVQQSTSAITVHVYAYDTSTGAQTELPPFSAGNTIGPCIVPKPTCDGYTIDPGLIDPNTPYKITASVRYQDVATATSVKNNAAAKFYLNVKGPGVDSNNPSVTPITQDDASLSVSKSFPATGNTGQYVVSWGVTGAGAAANIDCGGDGSVPPGPGEPNNPPETFDVSDLPYFDVNGGDVSVGSAMTPAGGTNCVVGAEPQAGIVSWNRGASHGYAGAGTAYAAMALSHLQEFASGQGSGLAPSGLAFANDDDGQISTDDGLYGGMMDGLPCVQDYFGTKPAGAKALSTLAHGIGAYSATGPTTLSGHSLNPGDHWTIYVDGDLYISGNLTYNGPYASAANIPSLKVYVKGSIFIAPGVTQLDGMYVAQPTDDSSDDGNIYTCATNTGAGVHPYSARSLNGSLYNACKTQLTVNGAFIANQVWLLRTAGTVTGSSAETFNFSPELWLSAPYDTSVDSMTTNKYDAITSLPPVL